jgi:MarR family protein
MVRLTEAATVSERHGTMIPASWLESLATRVKLHRSEWRIIALVLATPRPVTAGELAKRLKVDYSALKRLTRELVRWRILRRSYRRGDPPPWLPKEVLPPSAQAAATLRRVRRCCGGWKGDA